MENKHYPDQDCPQDLDVTGELPIIEELNFADSPEPIVLAEEILYPEEPAVQDCPEPENPPAAVDAAVIPEAENIPVDSILEEEPAFWIGEAPADSATEPAAVPYTGRFEAPATDPAEETITELFIETAEPSASSDTDPVTEILHTPEVEETQAPVLPAEQPINQEVSEEPKLDEAPVAEKGKKKKKDEAPRPTLKGRPKRKKGEGLFGIPNILVTFVWLALILAIGVTLGRMLWVCAADVLAFGRPDQKVTITVYEADTMEDVIDKLHAGGLIRYKSLFSLYADISDAEEDIKPGIYDLNTRYDYHALVNFMSPSSTREVIKLTIPEGYTCRQIFALLEENRVCTAKDIASYAANGELSDYWFLEDIVRGSEYCLEGFLFPDTYQFYKNSSPREALEKMLSNFDNRFSEEMRAQIDVLNANVTGGGYDVREIVIVASLIEKESAAPAESPTIASVIYNRLHNWDYPALLNIDAAIVYAQGGESDTIDTGIDSPYNTYRYTGLTPTPISNPGLSSLKAALNPETTKYYFYVLNPATGMHQFSTTQAEHDGWINEFYR